MTKYFLAHPPLNNFSEVKVSEEKGFRKDHPITKKPSPHNGIDLLPAGDLKVFAAHSGTVVESGYQLNQITGTGWGY